DHDARLQFVEKACGINGNLFQRDWQEPPNNRHVRDDAAIERLRYVSRRIAAATCVWLEPSYQRRTVSHYLPRLVRAPLSKLRASCAPKQPARRAENALPSCLPSHNSLRMAPIIEAKKILLRRCQKSVFNLNVEYAI